MLKAAMPYMDRKSASIAMVLARTDDLMECLQYSSPDLTGCSNPFSTDIGGLLQSVRPLCTKSELKMLDQISNIIMLKQMLDMFHLMKQKGDSSDTMWSTLEKQLSPEQRQQFEMMQMFMTMMNTSDADEGEPQ